MARQERNAFDEARQRTLSDSLALAPAERVQLAEDLWQEFTQGRKAAKPWTATFDTYDDYEKWRRQGGGRAA